ncbi:MAG: haloacid dehalogenase-like hydrolase [Planctomycetes bacterium]|nr:haloacid dehalogenase-like hydrolase [Planctomycetota bacterium]MCH9725083.1 haloacid dehalogenase-like hydrolase [Planctomycetota bacterium]MCH9774955.1 haloacid dehalogenase-like hydrolase [Planctomycetota bacterium]MCH9789737.1 haloacid dehalogenase-like hydrolase [Planctomycetota bacterium]
MNDVTTPGSVFSLHYLRAFSLFCIGLVTLCLSSSGYGQDPLPSWNEGATKTAIIAFVTAVTDKDGKDYVKPSDRIATFDNDGTLWVEYPMYTQLLFAFDRVKELAPLHPEWKTKQPFKAVLEDDMKTLSASGMKGVMEIMMATHSGMTSSEFSEQAGNWLRNTQQPRFKRPYAECVYQPQLELLGFLRSNGFKTFIVSGGGIAFMRPITEKAYGIPPEQVVGSSVVLEYQIKDGKPALIRMPKIDFIDDKAGKPVGIQKHIGRRPILAFGNSDSDMQMVEYTTSGKGKRLGLFVHHTDAAREYAYDRKSHIGKLDKALDVAKENGWIIVNMKKDWKQIFPWKE